MRRMIVIPLSCIAVSVGAQQLGPRPALHTPDSIAPAVLPYLACLYAERGLPLLRATDGSQVPYDHSVAGCSKARENARADAIKLLQTNREPGSSEPSKFVEQTLSEMDAYVASLPMSEHKQSSAVIGIPFTIEDEVKPAYDRYDECLKTQASNSPVTAARVLDLFKQAMATCTGIRQLAVSEATKALIGRGWDEPTRTHAAESTFAKVDESWLEMGRQYQQLLSERAEAQDSGAARPPKR